MNENPLYIMTKHVKVGGSEYLRTPKRLIKKHNINTEDQEYMTFVDDLGRIVHNPVERPEIIIDPEDPVLSVYAEQVITIMKGRTRKSKVNIWRAFQKKKGKIVGQQLLDAAIVELTQAGLFHLEGGDLMRGKQS